MLDCALIKLSAGITRPAISGVVTVLSPGQKVVLTGAVTKTSYHHLGSLCISYAFTGGGQDYCFRDAIELLPWRHGLFGRKTVPTQGDSGAWVLSDAQPQE